MSKRMMTVAEARETLNILDGTLSLTHASRAARTIVAQAEQIGRLQTALTEAEVIFWEATGHDLEQQLERKGVKLNHDDLEAAK